MLMAGRLLSPLESRSYRLGVDVELSLADAGDTTKAERTPARTASLAIMGGLFAATLDSRCYSVLRGVMEICRLARTLATTTASLTVSGNNEGTTDSGRRG